MLFCLGSLPSPGQGPSIEEENKEWWDLTFYGSVPFEGDQEPQIVKAHIANSTGPYTSTARTAVECAMCQVLEKERLKEPPLKQGGVLTPAAAFGDVLIRRLIAIGFKIETLP